MEPARYRLGPRDLVYFLHIPRTGAASFFELLATRFPPGTSHKGGDHLAADLRSRSAAENTRWRLLSGTRATDLTALCGRSPHVVTVVREPVARAMSRFESIKTQPHHPLHAEAVRMKFLDYLRHPLGGGEDATRQSRQIVALTEGWDNLPEGDALAERAKQRLQELAYFGLREVFADSARLLAWTFHWEPFQRIPRLNRSSVINHRLRLSSRELEEATSQNEADAQLYSFARRTFRERLRTLGPPPIPDVEPTVSAV